MQLLAAGLHVGIFFGISSSTAFAANVKETAYIFNATVLTTVLFTAYVPLGRQEEMLNSRLGRGTVGEE